MTATLSDIGCGFADPVHAPQQVFRALLGAMSRPGRVFRLPAPALDGIEPPQGIGAGLCALLLALLDGETSLHLRGVMANEETRAFLRFHTGVRDGQTENAAAFCALRAADAEPALWSRLDSGSDEVPQRGATLLVEVPSLDDVSPDLVLCGPGIEAMQPLAAGGLAPAFWRERIAIIEPQFPRGIDLVLVCGSRIAAVPRSTRVELQG